MAEDFQKECGRVTLSLDEFVESSALYDVSGDSRINDPVPMLGPGVNLEKQVRSMVHDRRGEEMHERMTETLIEVVLLHSNCNNHPLTHCFSLGD